MEKIITSLITVAVSNVHFEFNIYGFVAISINIKAQPTYIQVHIYSYRDYSIFNRKIKSKQAIYLSTSHTHILTSAPIYVSKYVCMHHICNGN